MSEQTIVTAAEQAALEAAYQFVSTEIQHLEATLPDRLAAAEQTVQDWGHDAVNALHRISAFIDQHRAAASTTPAPAAAPQQPAAAATAPAAAATTQTPAAAK